MSVELTGPSYKELGETRYVFYDADGMLIRVAEWLSTRVSGPHTGVGFADRLIDGNWKSAPGFDKSSPFVVPTDLKGAKKLAGKASLNADPDALPIGAKSPTTGDKDAAA